VSGAPNQSFLNNNYVMARLVRATHDLRARWLAAAPPKLFPAKSVFMGRPDKPGDDEQD